MIRTGRALAVAALLAAGSLATACGEDATVLDAGGVSVLVAAPADGGDAAAVRGTVGVVSGCLAIGEYVAVWPAGTRVVDEDGPVIDVPHLGEVRVGDQVTGAGGYHSPGDLSLPGSCRGERSVVYWHQ